MIDVINALDFDHGPQLLEHALPMAHNLAALKRRAKKAGIPAVYANDNFGRWQADLNAYMRDYALVVQSDCVASTDPAEAEHALEQMQVVVKAHVTQSRDLDLEALIAEAGEADPRCAARPLL
jgi:nicotinamidase-related amidase